MKRVLLLAVFVSIGCTVMTDRVIETIYTWNPGTIYFERNSPVLVLDTFTSAVLTMCPYYLYFIDNNTGQYRFRFVFTGSGECMEWFDNIEKFQFHIDGRIFDYEPYIPIPRPANRVYLWITVPERFYRMIEDANSVSMVVYLWNNRIIDKDIEPDTIERLTNFYTTVQQRIAVRAN